MDNGRLCQIIGCVLQEHCKKDIGSEEIYLKDKGFFFVPDLNLYKPPRFINHHRSELERRKENQLLLLTNVEAGICLSLPISHLHLVFVSVLCIPLPFLDGICLAKSKEDVHIMQGF